ncbi:MAG: hypothetical protein KZQ94_22180, partial [Candidatus Thiodiazotropha sp. (ex Troendleina suluensis)]|nr:hypothetical protein [Candidatus Thiodiazotropha sp. (ex Troendleina suluensis)]
SWMHLRCNWSTSNGKFGTDLHHFELRNLRYKRQLGKDGFFYSVGNGTEGLPDFYQTTFHTDAYIHEQWSKYFEIERILKKGIMSHQDLVICKNR